jgi:opacity protein-like surface antigen
MPIELAMFGRIAQMNRKPALATTGAVSAVAFALCVPAGAADLRVPYAREPAYVAPLIYNWTGFYVGAHFGGAFTSEDVGTSVGTFSTNPSGVLGGVQLGYNYQFSPNWLVGVEGELSWTSATGNASFTAGGMSGTFTSNHNWYDTLNGRFGYVQNNWMLYVKGGPAWMNADYAVTTPAVAGSVNSTRAGWTIGGGWEYLWAPNWSVKLEYAYLDFGSNGVNFGFAGANFNTQVHEVKLGVNYHWLPGTLFGRF